MAKKVVERGLSGGTKGTKEARWRNARAMKATLVSLRRHRRLLVPQEKNVVLPRNVGANLPPREPRSITPPMWGETDDVSEPKRGASGKERGRRERIEQAACPSKPWALRRVRCRRAESEKKKKRTRRHCHLAYLSSKLLLATPIAHALSPTSSTHRIEIKNRHRCSAVLRSAFFPQKKTTRGQREAERQRLFFLLLLSQKLNNKKWTPPPSQWRPMPTPGPP